MLPVEPVLLPIAALVESLGWVASLVSLASCPWSTMTNAQHTSMIERLQWGYHYYTWRHLD